MCATTLSVVAASLIAQSRYWCRGSESTWGICILNAPTRSCTHRRCGRVTSDALARGKAGALRARPPPRESVLIPPGGWHLSAQPLGACRHSRISAHGPAVISMHAGSLTRGCLLSSQSTLHVVEPRIPARAQHTQDIRTRYRSRTHHSLTARPRATPAEVASLRTCGDAPMRCATCCMNMQPYLTKRAAVSSTRAPHH